MANTLMTVSARMMMNAFLLFATLPAIHANHLAMTPRLLPYCIRMLASALLTMNALLISVPIMRVNLTACIYSQKH